MKSALRLIFALAIGLALVACKSAPEAQPEAQPQPEPTKPVDTSCQVRRQIDSLDE